MVRNLVGPPVLGIDFIGRKKELSAAWNALAATNSLLFSSPLFFFNPILFRFFV